MTTWERSLRPSSASGWLAGGSAVVCALAVAWIAISLSVPSVVSGRPEARSSAPAGAQDAASRPSAVVTPQEDRRLQRTQRLVKCIGPKGVAGYTDGECPAGSRAAALTELPELTVADGMKQEDRDAVQQANRIGAQLARTEVDRKTGNTLSIIEK